MAFLDLARKKAAEVDDKLRVFLTGTTVNLSNTKNTASNKKTSKTTSSAKSKSTKTSSNTSSNNSSAKKISTYPILKGNLPPNKGKTPILDSAFKAAAEEKKSRTTYSSAPKSSYTDFNTETKNAYTSAKNKASTKTTITSNLTEKERKARIKEIEQEMTSINTTLNNLGLASGYGGKKNKENLENQRKEAEKRKAQLSEELKKLKRVGTFSASELKQFEIDDAKARKAALPNYNPTARIMPYQADAFKANIQAHNELDKEIDRLEREKAEYKYFEKLDELNAYTTKITSKSDFVQNAKYSPIKPKTNEELEAEGYKQNADGKWYKVNLSGVDLYTGEDSDLYLYINDKKHRQAIKAEMLSSPGYNNIDHYEKLGYHTLFEEEIGAFNYLYHQDRKNGTNTAEEYLKNISPLLQQRAMEIEATRYAEMSKEAPVFMSGVSLGTNLANGLMFPAKVAATATGIYEDIPILDMYGNRTQAIRGAVSEDMGTVGKLAYNATMSIGDMGVAMLAGGGNSKVVQAIMSSSAGSSTISQAKKNGASDGKALILGLGSAAIEWATEKYSVEAILKKPKSILGYLATNTFTEATEEGASNVSNLVLDAIVSEVFGERNEIEQRIDYLVLYEGKTEEEALNIAFTEKLQSLGEDVLVGGITGFGMSSAVAIPVAVQRGIDRVHNKHTQKDNAPLNTTVSEEGSTIPKQQTSTPATLEQAAIDVVNERNQTNTPTYERLETLSRSNEPIAVEDVKKASGFGDNGAKLLTEIASQDGMTFVKARDEMKVAYLSGYNGEHTTFTSDLQNRAKLAGVDDRIADNNIAIENAKNATVYKGAFTDNEHTKNWSKATKKMVATVAKHFGMDIASVDRIIANELTGAEANASHNDGKMRISNNRTAEKLIHALVIHESGHRMEQFATDEWNELSNFLYNRAERLGRRAELGFNRGMAFDAVKAQHDNAGISMSTKDYIGEIAVRELETIFSSAEEFNNFIVEIESNQQAKSGFQKIVDFILELIEDVKRLIAETKMSKEERAEARKELAELERIKELYAKAYIATRNAVAERTKTIENSSTQQKGTKNQIDSGINFNLKKATENNHDTKRQNAKERFYSQLDSWDGETTGFSFVLGTTSKALIDAEVPNKQIRWDASKIKTLLNKHNGMTLDVVRQIPNLLENPVVVIDSKQDANARIIMGDLHDANGKLVTVVLLLTPTSKKGNQLDVIKVSSAQGRSHIESLFRNKDGSNVKVRFVDKKRIHSWLNVNRLQLPLHSFNLDSNNRIPQNPKSVKSDFSLKEKDTNVENTSQFSLKASNNGIYDYTKSFAQQVDDWKNGLIPQNDSLLVGATPKVFKKIGFNPLPFTINQRHIDYAINGTKDIDHSLGETLLAQLPQALENPLAIISSQTQPDRVVAILKIQHKGKNIVAPVEIDGFARQNNIRIDSNAIASVFGKGNAITKLLTDALNSEIKGSISVFYWNKKEAVSLLQRAGLQLSGGLPQDGFIHSITENGSPVKQRLKNITESQQFKRWFGNSKVVNKDGTPKIVYHGTSKGGHTVFDAWGKGKFGLFGIGIYMTESREVAEGYTKKGKGITPQVYELYANITNPLDMDKTANVKKWKKQTSGEIDFSNCTTNEDCFRAVKEYCEDEQMVRWEAEEYITEIIRDMGYDGITHIGGGRYNKQDATRHRVWIAFDSTQIKSATDNIGTFDNSNPEIRYSLKEIDNISSKGGKVSSSDKMVVRDGMTDEERYNILVNKSIENVPKVDNEKLKLIESKLFSPIREAYRLKATDRKKLFVKIGEEFEVFKNYRNEDIEVSFEFTKNGMRESEQHQKGHYETFAKLFSCFDEVIDHAIGIEVHNRNNEGYKVDKSLKEMYVLVSAFEDGKDIVPVKLEIKEFNDRANKLYVAVALEGIKKNEVVKQENTNNSVTQALARSNDEVVKSEFANKSRTDNSRSFNISLSQLLKKVNPKDQDFIKYIPKQFFEENKENLSLKDVETVPLKDLRNLVGVVEDLQNGKRGTSERLAKYIDKGIITTEEYDELVKTYGAIPSGENTSRLSHEPEAERYDIPEGSEIVNNIVVDEHSKRLKRENPRAYSNIIRMAKRLRMKVRFVKNLVDENGNVLEGLITSKGIFINADAKNPSRFVATHEFGHRMKQAAPKVWAAYQEYVINKLKRERFGNGRTAYDVLYEETKNAYGKDDADSINEEIAVNYAGELFDSEEMLESFIREDKSLAHKVRDWWYNVLESLGLLSEKKKAQQLWLKAYTAAGKNVKEGKVGEFSGEKFKYVGETDDGRKIYRTNYKEGTPKSVKQNDLINIIQNIWSKKPINLAIKENGVYKEISANFNPELSERSDLSKIVFGNRKGNGSEKRMTLDLSTDLYQIASDAKQTGSKAETGKDNKAHDGVKHWYYFITNLVYEDVNGEHIDCYMNIDVKENQSGHYFYSFAIEKGTAPQTLLAVVSDEMSPTVPTDTIISQDEPSVNSHSMQNTAENARDGKKSIPGTRLSELVEKYGAISTGENPHRDIQVPQKTAKDKKVSQTVRTILEAKATPDEAVPTIEKMVEDGIFSYDVYTDKQALDEANSNIKKYGWDESVDDWFKDVEKGIVSKQHTAMGWALYNNAANIAATTTSETERTSAVKTSLKILDAMVRHQRSAAQALQATRILKKLSPETQLYAAQKSVQAFQKELSDKYGDKAPNLEIDVELAEQFLNAKTPEERAEIETEIYKDIGRQMPSRFVDKWNAWRYLAMLGNVRTHVRNIGGNAFFAPVVMTKDLTATAIETIVHRVSGKKTVRGKALITGSKADRELLKAAWEDYGNVADLISNGGKYSDFAMANQKIEDGRQIFKFKPLELARKGNSALLEKEDMWFSKPHYAYALAQYCKANNITAEQIKRGKAIAPARDYAIKEAQKATYRDTNAFSQFVSDLGKNGKVNYVPKPVSMVVDGILPFRKTPANILVRGVEYSPLGLLKGLSYDLYQVSKGKMSATEAIDNISAGLTGTGLLGLGVYLAAQGLIRGHGEEDEEEKEFKELMGHQSYALELANGQSITLDWLAPESLPFFVGVNIWETTKGSNEELTLSTILNSVRNITEPMLEMSCLQGLNDLFEGIGYAKSNDTSGLVAVISSAVKSYLMQGLPTIFGQAERTGEEHRMTTYTEKDDFLTGDMQYTLGKASAKIPFWDYHQIPYIDAWGRKEASGVALKRGLNNFLNPAYTSSVKTSKMEKELLRLYESTGEASVFPSRADKYFTVDKKRKDLTADEYVRYATLKGKKSYKLITDLVKSDAYEILDDGEKVKAIEETYDYANQKAKEAISNYKPDTWVSKADEFSDVGSYITFRTEVSATKKENGDKISRQEVADIILDMAQNDSDMWNMYLSMYDSKGDKYAYDSGVSGEAYMYFLENLNEVDAPNKSGKYGTYTQAEATAAVNQLEGLSREEQRALWQSVNTTWKKNPF